MYNVSSSLYPLGLIEFHEKIKGLFVLNGAFCTVDTNSTTPSVLVPGSIPPLFNSSGLTYTTHPTITAAPVVTSTTPITEDNFVVHFTFYQKYEPTLTEDVTGEIYLDNGQYVVHISNDLPVLSVIEHNDVVIRTTILGPMTIEKLRLILGKVRSFFFLEALDQTHDVLPVPSTNVELQESLDEMNKYIKLVASKDYIYDMCVATSVSTEQKMLLSLRVHKKDTSKAYKDLITIELLPRKYEPTIILKTYFENDSQDPFKKIFKILETNPPLKYHKVISPKEADFFIKGVMSAYSELNDYKFVIKP